MHFNNFRRKMRVIRAVLRRRSMKKSLKCLRNAKADEQYFFDHVPKYLELYKMKSEGLSINMSHEEYTEIRRDAKHAFRRIGSILGYCFDEEDLYDGIPCSLFKSHRNYCRTSWRDQKCLHTLTASKIKRRQKLSKGIALPKYNRLNSLALDSLNYRKVERYNKCD